jgi:hypothetical protein
VTTRRSQADGKIPEFKFCAVQVEAVDRHC